MPIARHLATAALALTAVPALAALPPQHQRAAELRAVLDRAVEVFGSAPVDRIEYVREDLYRVSAGRCRLDAAIHGLPMPRGMVGARRFEVRLGRPICPR